MQHEYASKTEHKTGIGLSQPTTLIFAAAEGLDVANIYYAQPRLYTIAQDFGISPSAIGLVVMLTQSSYALN